MIESSKRAFTLIELLVVIIIIAIVAAVVIPAYTGTYERARFESETRHIQEIFSYARERAVSQDSTITITFNRDTFNTQSPPIPPPSDLPAALQNDPQLQNAGLEHSRSYTIGDEYQIEGFQTGGSMSGNRQASTQSEIHFNPDGTSDTARFVLVNRTGRTAHFSLRPASATLYLESDAQTSGLQ